MNRTARNAVIVISILLGSYLLTGAALARTNIEGLITGDALWSAKDSPYILTGVVALEKGFTLTIERNVTVIFTPDSQLRIGGRLDAYRVFFNGAMDINNQETLSLPAGTTARLIRCAFLDLNLVFNSSDIRLTGSVVSNRNGSGITVGKNALPQITNTSFHGNSYFAVYRHGATPLKVINCFWGSDTGPSGAGKGDGDGVSANVIYRPFKSREENDFVFLVGTTVVNEAEAFARSIQLSYDIFNLNTSERDAILGATILGPDKGVINHPSSDIRTTLSSGFQAYTRVFKLPPNFKDGIYDLVWGVMKTDLSEYYAYVKQSEIVEIRNARSRTAKRNLP